MSMVTAKCPRCEKNIQIPNDVEESYCAYCGNKIMTRNAILTSTNLVLIELKKLRDQELSDYLNGPGFSSHYHGFGLPMKHNAQIEEMDPKDVLSKELRICAEVRNMLYESCGDKGLFSPAGIRYIGSKVLVCTQYEPLVIQHADKINRDAQLLLSINPGYDFTPTKELFLDIVRLDRTPELYNLFSNGLVMAFIALQYFFIPAARKMFLQPLGDRMAEGFAFLAETVTLHMDETDLAYAHKFKVLNLKHLELLNKRI